MSIFDAIKYVSRQVCDVILPQQPSKQFGNKAHEETAQEIHLDNESGETLLLKTIRNRN